MRRIVVVLALLLGTTAWSAAGGLANSPAITPATAGSQLFTQDSPGVPTASSSTTSSARPLPPPAPRLGRTGT